MEEKAFRGMANRILHLIARFCPGATTIRPYLHRLRGVKIYGDVFIGDDVYLENMHPDSIEMHDKSEIGPRCTLLAHYKGPGKIIIESGASIRMGCLIGCPQGKTLTIGEGSLVGMGSVVVNNIPPFTFAVGNPAKPKYKMGIPLALGTEYTIDEWRAALKPIKKE